MNATNIISMLMGQNTPTPGTKKGAEGGQGVAGVLAMGASSQAVNGQNGEASGETNLGAVFQSMLTAEATLAQNTPVPNASGQNIVSQGNADLSQVQAKILDAQNAASSNAALASQNQNGATAVVGEALVLPTTANANAGEATHDVIIASEHAAQSANNSGNTQTGAAQDNMNTANAGAVQNAGVVQTASNTASNNGQTPSNHSKAQTVTSPTIPSKTVGSDNDVTVASLGVSAQADPSGNLGGEGDAKSVPSAVSLAPETTYTPAAHAGAPKAAPLAAADAQSKPAQKSGQTTQAAAASSNELPAADNAQLKQANAVQNAAPQAEQALAKVELLASESPRAQLNAAEARGNVPSEGKSANALSGSNNASQNSAQSGGQNASSNNGQSGGNGQNPNTPQDAQRLMAQMAKADAKPINVSASQPVESFEELLQTPASQAIANGVATEARPNGLQHASLTSHNPAMRATAAVQNLGLQISKSVAEGESRFTIRMDPPSLGRIDVKMEMMADGKMKAYLSVESRETMNLLQRDSASLERTLQDAGLKIDQNSLNFSLKQQGEQAENEFKSASNNTAHGSDGGFEGEMADDDVTDVIMQHVITDSAVDIRI